MELADVIHQRCEFPVTHRARRDTLHTTEAVRCETQRLAVLGGIVPIFVTVHRYVMVGSPSRAHPSTAEGCARPSADAKTGADLDGISGSDSSTMRLLQLLQGCSRSGIPQVQVSPSPGKGRRSRPSLLPGPSLARALGRKVHPGRACAPLPLHLPSCLKCRLGSMILRVFQPQ